LSRCSSTNFEYLSKVADFNPEELGTEDDDDSDVGDDYYDQLEDHTYIDYSNHPWAIKEPSLISYTNHLKLHCTGTYKVRVLFIGHGVDQLFGKNRIPQNSTSSKSLNSQITVKQSERNPHACNTHTLILSFL
jgi:hypothetical protein